MSLYLSTKTNNKKKTKQNQKTKKQNKTKQQTNKQKTNKQTNTILNSKSNYYRSRPHGRSTPKVLISQIFDKPTFSAEKLVFSDLKT